MRKNRPASVNLWALLTVPKSYRKRKGRKAPSVLAALFGVKRSGGKLRKSRKRTAKPTDWKAVERRNEKRIEKLWEKKGWL